jgi:hypothetical protein
LFSFLEHNHHTTVETLTGSYQSYLIFSYFPVLSDFDRAWTTFEQKICYWYARSSLISSYFHVTYNSGPGSVDDTQMFQVLISETIMRAISTNIISDDDINSVDPRVIIAIPRLTIITALHWMPDSVNITDGEKGFRLFREKADRMQSIKEDLEKMSKEEIGVLEGMLVDCDAWDNSLKRTNTLKPADASNDSIDISRSDIGGLGDTTIINQEEEAGNSTLLEATDEKHRNTMHRVYRDVCYCADDMGPRAREFVGILHKAFSMHTEQE